MNEFDLGLDIGYNSVKVVGKGFQAVFPSVIGTPNTAIFSIGSNKGDIVSDITSGKPYRMLYGYDANETSKMIFRSEDRAWISSDLYKHLIVAAMAESRDILSSDQINKVNIVSGLPVAYYAEDAELLKNILKGNYVFEVNGATYEVEINPQRIIPQPFGTILSELLDSNGKVEDNSMSRSHVGVIDIGGKTTNILGVKSLSDIPKETSSINQGGWDVIHYIQEVLPNHFPGAELSDSDAIASVQDKRYKHNGKWMDISSIVEEAKNYLLHSIDLRVRSMWGNCSSFDKIFLSGGGSNLVADEIMSKYPMASMPKTNTTFANATGYYRFLLRLKS